MNNDSLSRVLALLVTDLDWEIEQFLIGKIRESYPDFDIVSEEYNTNNEVTDNCFIIDPIDGTINFANKLPLWGIQIACIKDGKRVASVIYTITEFCCNSIFIFK